MKNYVIVGGGTAGWISAAILSNLFKHTDTKVSLIESPDIPTVGVGEATIPSILDLLNYLNIPHKEFIRETNATFKLGIKFTNWLRKGHHYWHPFGTIGGVIDTLPFYQQWRRYKARGQPGGFTDFSPAIVMARNERFYISNPEKPDLFSASDYALHFDASKVARFLEKFAIGNGVSLVKANVTKVNTTDTGEISSVLLDNKTTIDGDFFIDCSGQRALLIHDALGVPYEDWSKYLPVDRAIAVQTESTANFRPYTESTAHDSGWRWNIPLQTRVGNGYVYCSSFCDDDRARQTLMSNLESKPVNEPRIIKFLTGKRQKVWHKNCVSIGLSSGFLEPLESTSIHLIMKAMLYFIQMLPQGVVNTATVNEFNRLMDIEFECIRDFIVLHYCETERDDTDFWRWWLTADIPASLEAKLELFKSQGRLFKNDMDLFQQDSWYAVLDGMGVQPHSNDPIAQISSAEKIDTMLNKRLDNFNSAVRRLPYHIEYLRQFID